MAHTNKLKSKDQSATGEGHIDLEFPTHIFENGSTISLRPYYRYTEFHREALADSKINKSNLGGTIYLPVPPALSEVIANEWESTLNANNLADVMIAQIGVKLTEVLGAFGRKAQIKSGISNVNADIVQLYKGSQPREFTFSWNLLPTSEEEAENLRKIVRVFKYYSSPSIAQGHRYTQFMQDVVNGMRRVTHQVVEKGQQVVGIEGGSNPPENMKLSFLSYPATWDINILYHSPNGGKVNLFQILDCVNTSLTVTYSDGESFNFYRGGHPIKLSIEASFRETRLFTTEVMDTESMY